MISGPVLEQALIPLAVTGAKLDHILGGEFESLTEDMYISQRFNQCEPASEGAPRETARSRP